MEAWLPVDASSANRLVAHASSTCQPAGPTLLHCPGSEVAAGIVLYALGAFSDGVLAIAIALLVIEGVRDAGCVRWVEAGHWVAHAFREVQSHLVPPWIGSRG